MAQGDTTVASLNSMWAHIYEDAVFVVREQQMALRLVTTFTNGRGDQVRYLSTYPEVTAAAVAETEDFQNPTVFGKTQLSSLTPGEIMAQIILTDREIETDPQQARANSSIELGAATGQKIDTDVLGNFASLTGGTIGGLGSAATWGQFYAALTIMRDNKIPRPWYAVYHPFAWHSMGTAAAAAAGVSQTNSPWLQDNIMQNFWVDRVATVDIFINANVKESGGTGAYNAMFARPALAYDLRRAVRLEPERDASARAWELNVSALYAHGIWRPTFGVQILTAATTPTG